MTKAEKQTLANKKSYAKKKGLTLEEYEELQEQRKEKQRKNRRDYKVWMRRKKLGKQPFDHQGHFTEAQMAAFREKHKQWGGTRLDKSINKVVFLTRFQG